MTAAGPLTDLTLPLPDFAGGGRPRGARGGAAAREPGEVLPPHLVSPPRVYPRAPGHYGIERLFRDDGEVVAQVPVRDALKQPAGLVHGGVFASIAESICSTA